MLCNTGLPDYYLKCFINFVIMDNFNVNESYQAIEFFLNQAKCKNISASKPYMPGES